MAGKKRQTFGKITRERARMEKREQKLERKAEQKQAAAEAREAGVITQPIGPPNQQGADDAPVFDAAGEGAPPATTRQLPTD